MNAFTIHNTDTRSNTLQHTPSPFPLTIRIKFDVIAHKNICVAWLWYNIHLEIAQFTIDRITCATIQYTHDNSMHLGVCVFVYVFCFYVSVYMYLHVCVRMDLKVKSFLRAGVCIRRSGGETCLYQPISDTFEYFPFHFCHSVAVYWFSITFVPFAFSCTNFPSNSFCVQCGSMLLCHARLNGNGLYISANIHAIVLYICIYESHLHGSQSCCSTELDPPLDLCESFLIQWSFLET